MKSITGALKRITASEDPDDTLEIKNITIRGSYFVRAGMILKQLGFPSNSSEVLSAVYPMFEAYVATELAKGKKAPDIIAKLRPVKSLIMSFSKQAQKKLGQ